LKIRNFSIPRRAHRRLSPGNRRRFHLCRVTRLLGILEHAA
jgi:hypothetical protein